MTFLGLINLEGGEGFTKDTAEGLRLVRQAASAGDALAAFTLGGGYEFGREGMSKEEAEALRWYRKAADAGSATAMARLADSYAAATLGLTKNETEAAEWYRRASDRGNVHSTYRLALMYRDGRGVPKDEPEAARLFANGDMQKNTSAMLDVGHELSNGQIVAKDEAEALKWFRKAADLGDQFGMVYLAIAYRYGQGVAEAEQDRDAICGRSLTVAQLRSIRARCRLSRLFPQWQANVCALLGRIFHAARSRERRGRGRAWPRIAKSLLPDGRVARRKISGLRQLR